MATAGTKEPICAIKTSSAVCRTNTDLPPMFGPVMQSAFFWFSPPPNRNEFGTTLWPPTSVASRIGCLPCVISSNDALVEGESWLASLLTSFEDSFNPPLPNSFEDSFNPPSSSPCTNSGAQYPSCLPRLASEHSASSPAAALTAARNARKLPAHCTFRKETHAAAHFVTCLSRARSSARAFSTTAGGWYRITFLLLFVLTRTQSCGTFWNESESSIRNSTSATVT
mmetsp:Transcript_6582/g.22142  ORF Transcript_6582/g.22142 Transcript_6582/m.22142 type:complete len:226 (+) Transcript_6582:961-1638(+)